MLGIQNRAIHRFIPHISIHAPGNPRRWQNNLYHTKFHFVIGEVTQREMNNGLYSVYPMNLEKLCNENKILFNKIVETPNTKKAKKHYKIWSICRTTCCF